MLVLASLRLVGALVVLADVGQVRQENPQFNGASVGQAHFTLRQ
jgi:hypothetical protein